MTFLVDSNSEVLFESYPEELVITYPDEWGLADVARFMNAEIERYGLFGVSYLASGENQVVLTHERIESEAEREALIRTLSSDLDEYAGSLSVSEEKTEANATVTASSGEAESATSQNTVSRTIGYGGYLVLLESHPDDLVITYPAVIGLSEVYAFLEEEEERYALEGISILATGEDEVTVYHEGIESEERRAEILLTLERDLIEYLGRLSGAGTVVESLTEKERRR